MEHILERSNARRMTILSQVNHQIKSNNHSSNIQDYESQHRSNAIKAKVEPIMDESIAINRKVSNEMRTLELLQEQLNTTKNDIIKYEGLKKKMLREHNPYGLDLKKCNQKFERILRKLFSILNICHLYLSYLYISLRNYC